MSFNGPSAYTDPQQRRCEDCLSATARHPHRNLEAELRTFITDGEFGRGLLRILESFRSGLGQRVTESSWISGFYGSGKSHMAKMLCALWTNTPFLDGASPISLLPDPPSELAAELRSLRAASERAGGLHAAGGPMERIDDPKLVTLGIVLRRWAAAGFPRGTGCLLAGGRRHAGGVRARLGGAFDSAIRADSCISIPASTRPSWPKNQTSPPARGFVGSAESRFPQPPEITVAELSSTIRRALLLTARSCR